MTRAASEMTLFQVVAARKQNGGGWTLAMIAEGSETIDSDLAALSLLSDTRMKIVRGVYRGEPRRAEILPFEKAFDFACGTGWSFDYPAECWRAPEEAILAPLAGANVKQIGVAFQPPKWGWIDTRFATTTQSFECSLTNVCDRLKELVGWLERVAGGATPRFWYDVEGREVEFHLWPHAGRINLLVAHNTILGREEHINVVLSREALVQSVYFPLISYWEGPEMADNWRHWASYTEQEGVEVDENGYRLRPYPLRSPLLDRLFGADSPCGGPSGPRP